MARSLTHLDADGRARMIDVGGKPATRREALARGRLVTTAEVVRLLVADGLPKADALATARIAGIAGAKRTGDLIPLCHPLALDAVSLHLLPEGSTVLIEARVSTTGRTGVEMEALTAVAVAGLTLHDMVKAVDPGATITDVQLVEKTGGRHGRWTRDPDSAVDATDAAGADAAPEAIAEGAAGAAPEGAAAGAAPEAGRGGGGRVPVVSTGGGRVLVVSTGAATGSRTDMTGARITAWLRGQGLETPDPLVVADADVAAGLRAALQDGPEVLITTGGTGPSPTDRTPEATAALLDRPLPGIAEALRTRAGTPTAALGRGVAGLAGGTIVVNLPGSAGGVDDGLAVLGELLPHLRHQVRGEADHEHGAHQSTPGA